MNDPRVLKDVWTEGYRCYQDAWKREENPYDYQDPWQEDLFYAWDKGWCDACWDD